MNIMSAAVHPELSWHWCPCGTFLLFIFQKYAWSLFLYILAVCVILTSALYINISLK